MGQNQTMQARITGAVPLTPKRFENDWTVELMDAQGAPLDDVELTSVCAWMPAHLHAEPPQGIKRLGAPPSFELSALNLAMRGPWEVQLTVKSQQLGGTPNLVTRCDKRMTMPGTDLIVLRACIGD